MARRKEDWEEKAIKRPGRVIRYMKKKYGKEAFLPNGTINIDYLYESITQLEAVPHSQRNESLLHALNLAVTLKTMNRRRKRRDK